MTKKIIFGAAMALLSLTSCYTGSNNESVHHHRLSTKS